MRTLATLAALTLAVPALAGEITGKVTASKGAGGIVVYVVKADGQFAPPEKPVAMDQKHMAFLPFVLPVLAGTTVEFKNSDKVAHNVFSPDGAGYNLGTFSPGQTRKQLFGDPGLYTQLCSLHPDMEGYILVLQNPYFATTAADGGYTIKGVPDGDYQVRVMGKSVKKKDRKKDFPVTVAGSANLDIEL
ncbi:MAG TPA: carboxypeptidase regulatory-like domain-containing protein [Myxococcales bacterium]|nr:carboxypeptidase regulatory-like domain-containing protein [Myxococcales bacterium]